jgi:hypothetical protein
MGHKDDIPGKPKQRFMEQQIIYPSGEVPSSKNSL